MKGVRMAALALVVLAAATGCQAAVKNSAAVVKVMPATTVVSAAAGQRVEWSIKLDIAASWHIYAHADTNFIGVDLKPAEDFPLDDLQVAYPAGHQKEFFGEKVFMIAGKDVIRASALVPAGLPKGEYSLAFKVTAQACDDKTCLAPAYIPVTVKLTVK